MESVSNGSSVIEESQENLQSLDETTPAPLADIKDEMVKQHMKLAEEAIAGWEKAEREVAVTKEKLELAIQQKHAAEEKASHLDAALKECIRQLRHAREEQEQKAQDSRMEKTKEWEKTRVDMETTLAETAEQLNKALAEKQAMEVSLQQLINSDKRKDRLLTVAEKENVRFRSELLAVTKEIDICIKERELNRKAVEAAHKQNLEKLKKFAKLEDECQRLRLLVKTRATVSQSKELDSELSCKKPPRKVSPVPRNNGSKSTEAAFHSALGGGFREENKLLSCRLVAMEEETKSLNAQLAKRDRELQEARLLLSKCVNRPLQVETLADINTVNSASLQGISGLDVKALGSISEPSIGSLSADKGGAQVCVESWASALIAELSHIGQEKKALGSSESLSQSVSLDKLMDDFAEMEKLASLSPDIDEHAEGHKAWLKEKVKKIDRVHLSKAGETTTATTSSGETEGHALSKFKEACRNGTKQQKDVHNEDVDLEMSPCTSYFNVDKTTGDSEFSSLGAQLGAAVRSVLDLAERIAQTDYSFAYPEWLEDSNSSSDGDNGDTDGDNGDTGRQWKRMGMDSCVESLVNLCNSLKQGKADVMDFIAEVASALDWMVDLIFSSHANSPERSRSSERHSSHGGKTIVDNNGADVTTATEMSPGNAASEVLPDQSSVSNLSFRFSEISTHEEELTKATSEDAALNVELEAEAWKIERLQYDILKLKAEYSELEKTHDISEKKLDELSYERDEVNEQVRALTQELVDSKTETALVQYHLENALEKLQSVGGTISSLESQNFSLEYQLRDAKESAAVLERKVCDLEEQLKEEVHSGEQMSQQYLQLKRQQQNDHGGREGIAQLSADDEASRWKKEQNMAAAAEKLAECQQNILLLGEQLKALGAPAVLFGAPLRDATIESLSNTTVHSVNQSSFEAKNRNLNSNSENCDGDVEGAIVSNSSSSWFSRFGRSMRRQETSGAAVKPSSGEVEGTSRVEQRGQEAQPQAPKKTESHRKSSTPMADDSILEYSVVSSPSSYSASSSPACRAKEAVCSSALSSPARFGSLRGRNLHNLGGEAFQQGESGEMHGSSGHSRFFGKSTREDAEGLV